MTDPVGNNRTFDNNPSVTVPHEFNHGYDGELLETDPIVYPAGYTDTIVSFKQQRWKDKVCWMPSDETLSLTIITDCNIMIT